MSEDIAGPSTSELSSSLENAKHEALRKAGEEYFEQFLEQARKGKNILNAPPGSRKKNKDVEKQDEDLETIGLVLEGSRLYVIETLFFASHAARLVLAKLSVESLETPAVQMFLHLLPAVCATYAVVETGPFTGKTLRASTMAILLFGIQTLALFGALKFSSLYLVLAWTTMAPPALAYQRSMQQPGLSPGILHTLLVAIGVSGAGVAIVSRLVPSLMGSLCLLAWTAAEVGQTLWEAFKSNPDTSLPQLGGNAREQLVCIAKEEGNVSLATKTLYQSALSAVFALLLGFCCQEGSKLVDHELSVPAVSNMMLSCAAWTVSTVTGILLFGAVSAQTQARLSAFTASGALILQVVMSGVGQPMAFCSALLAVIGGIGARQYRS